MLVLRVAAASASTGLPIAMSTLSRLADSAAELPTPWPREALDLLLVLLAAGPDTVAVIETLDRTGLWCRLFPEWAAIRDLLGHVQRAADGDLELAVYVLPIPAGTGSLLASSPLQWR